MGGWARNIELTAGRAGLLLCGDLATASSLVRAESRPIGGLTPDDRRHDLISFVVSPEHSELRARYVLSAPVSATPPAAVPPRQPEPPDAPAEPEPDPSPPGDPGGKAAPTRNGMRVVEAMRGRPPMRKVDIAVLAGIGRGAANRTVERLVADGWMVPDGHNLFRLAG